MNQDNQREATLFAYLAGIIDSEGTIRITCEKLKAHPNWNPRYNGNISVGMTDKNVIDLLRDTFTPEGTIWTECVPNRKIVYRWGTSGNIIIPKILKPLLPYLRVKKQQAVIVLELCEKKKVTGFRKNKGIPESELRWREQLYWKVKKLNAVGAPATTK